MAAAARLNRHVRKMRLFEALSDGRLDHLSAGPSWRGSTSGPSGAMRRRAASPGGAGSGSSG
jgi:hypothetical protein